MGELDACWRVSGTVWDYDVQERGVFGTAVTGRRNTMEDLGL